MLGRVTSRNYVALVAAAIVALVSSVCLVFALSDARGGTTTTSTGTGTTRPNGDPKPPVSTGLYRLHEIFDYDGWRWAPNGNLLGRPSFFRARDGKALGGAFNSITNTIKKLQAGPALVDGLWVDARGRLLARAHRQTITPDGMRQFTDLGVPTGKRKLAYRDEGELAPDGRWYGVAYNIGAPEGEISDTSEIQIRSVETDKFIRRFATFQPSPTMTRPEPLLELLKFQFTVDTTGSMYALGRYKYSSLDGRSTNYEDPAGERWVKYSPEGKMVLNVPLGDPFYGDTGPYGGIAVGPTGNVYISLDDCDAGPSGGGKETGCGNGNIPGRIRKYSPEGVLVTEWGLPGRSEGIAVDSKDNVLAADSERSRVIQYSSTGRLLSTLGAATSGQVALSPDRVAVDRRTDDVYAISNSSVIYRWALKSRARQLAKCRKLPTKTKTQRKASGRCFTNANS